MQTGLYKATFTTPLGSGTGVVAYSDGVLRGGDSAIAYVGTVEEAGSSIKATFRTFRHSQPTMSSVLGDDDVEMHVTGAANDTSAVLTGQVPGLGVTFTVRLDLIAA